MRKILIFSAFVFLANTLLFSQEISNENSYINAFEADSVVWKCRFELGIPDIASHPTTEAVLYGDTVIGNTKWRILSMSDIAGQFHKHGLIRSDGDKVIFRAYPGNEGAIREGEFVIYDFSLNVGDVFVTGSAGGGEVISVDSIELNDGKKHKRIHFRYGYNYVEGLGCEVDDPFYMIYSGMPTMSSTSTLISCHVNGKLFYKNPLYSDYTPLLDETKQWNVLYENASKQKLTHVFKLNGDTVIEKRSYSVLWVSVDEKVEDWRRLGYIHENIEERKIYYRPSWGDRDGLLYDFSAEENDTVYTVGNSWLDLNKPNGDYWMTDSIVNVVKSVDLVKLNDKYQKRVIVESKLPMTESEDDAFENKWIEGIGNLKGLFSFNIMLPGTPNQTLLAFYQNDELIYHSREHNQEFIWETVGNELIDNNPGFSISLSGKQLFIKNELNEQPYVVTLYSVNGMLILQKKENAPSTIIQLPDSLYGIFIVNISSGNRSTTMKVLINRGL